MRLRVLGAYGHGYRNAVPGVLLRSAAPRIIGK